MIHNNLTGLEPRWGRITRNIGRWVCLSWLLVSANSPLITTAQPEGLTVGGPEPARVGKAEPTSDEASAVELPYSQILRDTTPPYERLFRDVRVGGRLTPKIGSADALFETRLFGVPHVRLPIDRGLEPKDAELKFGPFYLDLRALSGSLLYSDNVRLSATNREDGVIGIVRLTSVARFQIGDNLRLSMLGTLVYLPFRGEIGVAGFGIGDPLAAFTASGPLTRSQLTYDLHLSTWEIELFDDLGARTRRFGAMFGSSFDVFEGEQFDEEDRAGRYVFADRTPMIGAGNARSWDSRFGGQDLIEVRNLVGAYGTRLLPAETRFEFGGSRADYQYYGDWAGRLPAGRNMGYAMLVSERETMRFKPFARYRVFKYDYQDNWDQDGYAGIQGPVTENLRFLGEVGYFEGGGSEGGTLLWTARLRHSINPLTHQQLRYARGTTEPDRGFHESWSYRLTHIFRPDLEGQLYAIHSTFEPLGGGGSAGDEDRAGLHITCDLAQRVTLRLAGTYTRIAYARPDFADSENLGARAEIRYYHRKGLEGWVIYHYRDHDSPMRAFDFHENLVILTLVKHF